MPVSLGINLATGSTNRLSPPISRQRTDSYLYCQVAAAAAPEKREDSSKKPRRIGTPVKQNARQQDTFGGPGNIRSFHRRGFCLRQLRRRFMQQLATQSMVIHSPRPPEHNAQQCKPIYTDVPEQ